MYKGPNTRAAQTTTQHHKLKTQRPTMTQRQKNDDETPPRVDLMKKEWHVLIQRHVLEDHHRLHRLWHLRGKRPDPPPDATWDRTPIKEPIQHNRRRASINHCRDLIQPPHHPVLRNRNFTCPTEAPSCGKHQSILIEISSTKLEEPNVNRTLHLTNKVSKQATTEITPGPNTVQREQPRWFFF